jgi:pyruvoyl-dependent arginine decarboxylase (PvlArgDC)
LYDGGAFKIDRRSGFSAALREMKIADFNINNVNKHFANLLQWLRTAKP